MSEINLGSIRGILFGAAFGDSLAAAAEFKTVEEILDHWPPNGPEELEGEPALVTDDTQMMLAVGEALLYSLKGGTPSAQSLEKELRRTFIAWFSSPKNNRAPGRSCLEACENLADGQEWLEATSFTSKGCGANMRVQPVALLPKNVDGLTRSAIAQFQAAMTHGHATALAASDLTAKTIELLCNGIAPEDLVEALLEYCRKQRNVYASSWLGNLWQRPGVDDPLVYISRGWDECRLKLSSLDNALFDYDPSEDPCPYTGDGWIAEEALATALLCFLSFPEDPVQVIRRAAVTKGDSDSIACLAGSFAGAYTGSSLWPEDWFTEIEYADELDSMSHAFASYSE